MSKPGQRCTWRQSRLRIPHPLSPSRFCTPRWLPSRWCTRHPLPLPLSRSRMRCRSRLRIPRWLPSRRCIRRRLPLPPSRLRMRYRSRSCTPPWLPSRRCIRRRLPLLPSRLCIPRLLLLLLLPNRSRMRRQSRFHTLRRRSSILLWLPSRSCRRRRLSRRLRRSRGRHGPGHLLRRGRLRPATFHSRPSTCRLPTGRSRRGH